MRVIFWLLILWAGTVLAQNKTLGTAKLPAGTEKRAAVIFANQDYTDPRYDLQKSHNDADDMKKVLNDMGFKVVVFKKDLNERSFAREIQALRDTLRGYQVVFFYYSGHGAEYRGENYLIPTDVSLEFNADIEAQGIKLSTVYEVLQDAGVKTSIVALDACRSLPVGKGNLSNGLVIPANNPAGTFTMYATRAGKVAKENLNGRNSYFTQELKKNLPLPNLTLNQIHYQIRADVKKATYRKEAQNEVQEPGVANELDGEFIFLLKELPLPPDPEKEALRAEIERLKAEREAALKNAAAQPVNTRVTPPTVTPTRPTVDLPFMEMVFVKGGTFKMGSNDGESDEKPVHNVSVSSFLMGKYEVTVEQFAAFVAATNYKTDAEKGGSSRLWNPKTNLWYDSTGIHWRHDANGKLLSAREYNPPVVHVSHNDAVAFCGWLSKKESKIYRLPTEAEWEYAAGNGIKHTKYSWEGATPKGNVTDKTFATTFNGSKTYTIFEGYTDSYATTAPVGSFDANICGLYDMTGNVWEWCADWFADDWYAQASARRPNTNNQTHGSKTFRVLRGGSWFSTPSFARVSNRSHNTPSHRSNDYGFRVVSPSQL